MYNDKINNLSTVRVLYVEDDLETREELQSVLENFVAELYIAKNGREGLNLYREHRPDIVVTDIQMPEMNGLSMAADIKAINADQPIVILSAYNDVEYLFRSLELGIQHYITKPISIERLLNKLCDISEQLNWVHEVEKSRKLLEQYKLLVDAKAIVAKVNLNGTIVYANSYYCNLSGYSEAELLGQHYLFNIETGQATLIEDLETTVLAKKKWQGVLKQISKTGDTYVVDVTIVAIVNHQGDIEEFVALLVDITEQFKKFERLSIGLEQDLIQQNHYLREYESAMEVGTLLCVIDTTGTIISANQNFSALIHYTADELQGNSLCQLVQNCDEFKAEALNKALHQGHSSMIVNIKDKKGEQRVLSTVFVGIHNEQGDIHSIMALSQDITEIIQLHEEMIETQKELIYILGEVIENHSHETGSHIKRVALMSELIASKYGLDKEHSTMIKIASSLHDIGKVGLPHELLCKTGKLSADEYQIVKKHAEIGFNLLKQSEKPLIKMAATIAHQHHERYDGTGYPDGLFGADIALEARIVSIADVFDALCSKRVYKEPWPIEYILTYFESNKSSQFDPQLVDILIQNIDEILQIRKQLSGSNA
ncbi:hypothetical protein VZ94_07340 [Methylocucumis oryzae]|uniref:Histidine kinase n=1 Tax=Methylocucumis oryzae TaxID=1632867 RepID=A0A0F3IKL7_9GAMM|nr:hypothetical protein VZ94_07340 [Methylocucumis oryzae]